MSCYHGFCCVPNTHAAKDYTLLQLLRGNLFQQLNGVKEKLTKCYKNSQLSSIFRASAPTKRHRHYRRLYL
ncbi:hypothetical protein TSUD_301760 [Trifolium subterraneum]|uniref:Uncharacterized protein n=1 Tax=Trifolium subterraneum TaxID=3900 RepID=A0A2Z6NXG5_TRISU|nr:hypothetical protein TSUD_301760 [Trifolium subterraneum]